jgi:hypothetical protein
MNGRASSTIPPQVSQLGNVPPPGRRCGLTDTWTGHSQMAALRAADGTKAILGEEK